MNRKCSWFDVSVKNFLKQRKSFCREIIFSRSTEPPLSKYKKLTNKFEFIRPFIRRLHFFKKFTNRSENKQQTFVSQTFIGTEWTRTIYCKLNLKKKGLFEIKMMNLVLKILRSFNLKPVLRNKKLLYYCLVEC